MNRLETLKLFETPQRNVRGSDLSYIPRPPTLPQSTIDDLTGYHPSEDCKIAFTIGGDGEPDRAFLQPVLSGPWPVASKDLIGSLRFVPSPTGHPVVHAKSGKENSPIGPRWKFVHARMQKEPYEGGARDPSKMIVQWAVTQTDPDGKPIFDEFVYTCWLW